MNIIENSRKGAATDSAYGYKDAVNKFYIAELQNHNKLKLDGTYTVKSDGSLEPTEDNTFGFGDENVTSFSVQVSGTVPSSGKLRYSNNVLNAGCVVIGDYKVTFGTDGKVDGTVKGDCTNYVISSDTETWTKYYYSNNEEPYETVDTEDFDNTWNEWIQENSNKRQVCAKFESGIECITLNLSGYNTNFGTKDENNHWIVTGYPLNWKNYMESKGETCQIYDNQVSCGSYPSINLGVDGGACAYGADQFACCIGPNDYIECGI